MLAPWCSAPTSLLSCVVPVYVVLRVLSLPASLSSVIIMYAAFGSLSARCSLYLTLREFKRTFRWIFFSGRKSGSGLDTSFTMRFPPQGGGTKRGGDTFLGS